MKKRVWIALLVICLLVGLLATTALAAGMDETEYDKILYVNVSAGENGNGTKAAPFNTLEDAVGSASGKTLIYVMSDITLTSKVGIWEKNVTIASEPAAGQAFTISRGDSFNTAYDPARGYYNPAMIEVGGTTDQGVVAYLRLENIILDDRGIAQGGDDGEYFIQAASGTGGKTDFGDLKDENAISNTDIVQDAIIATYNGTGEITLGSGTVLKNYGGMSAVRISGGKLIMEKGSVICDDSGINRTNGTTIPKADGLYGPAGAVWMQGGELVMEDDSEIRDMVGRAVYADGGSVTMNGNISNITASDEMWMKKDGFIIHLRSSATATIGSTALVDNELTSTSGNGFFILGGCSLTADDGAVIKRFNNGNVFMIQYDDSLLDLDCEITECTGSSHIVQASTDNFKIIIGENANIHNNTVGYGAIYAFSNDNADGECGVIELYGRINDNLSTDRGGAIAMANNGSSLIVNMYDGAEICNNVSEQTGGGIMVSCGTFNMYGGTISGNISGASSGLTSEVDISGGGVYVRRGGQFNMYGGEITGNSSKGFGGGIAFVAGDYNGSVPYIQLNGGTISGNKMNATVSGNREDGYTASDGVSNDITVASSESSKTNRYISIGGDFVLGEQSIYMAKHDFYLENIGEDVKLGNTSTANENSLGVASAGKGWSDDILAALWLQSDDAQELVFSGVDGINADLPVYALAMATDANGNVAAGTTATVYAVTENTDGTLAFNIHPTGANGCAIAFVQPGTHYGTLVKGGEPSSIAFEDFDGEHATISYTTTYTLSDNIKNQIIADGHQFILSINLDDSLSLVDGTMNIDGESATSTVDSSGSINVPFTADNDTDTVVVTFDAKLHVDDFFAGGQLISASEVSTTIGTKPVSIPSNAVITNMEPFTISASAGSGGSISPSGDVEVNHNDDVTFTITPDSDYEIADVLVDGVSVGAVSTYKFENVICNHTISATFKSKFGGVVTITPADITVYTGGEGYTGVVDDDGTTTTANGLPEPGYYITLPKWLNDRLGGTEQAANLTDILTINYNDGNGTTRQWDLELYGTEAHSTDIAGTETARYIYRLTPGKTQDGTEIPVRLQFTDGNDVITNDEFTPDLDGQLYKEYDMTIYSGSLDESKITAEITVGGKTYSCAVDAGTGNLVVRGLTGVENTTVIADDTSKLAGSITAVAPSGTVYYVNGSNVQVTDTDGVKLLVDDVLDDGVLAEYIENEMNAIPDGSYVYDQRYLDLVDTTNGNVYLTTDKALTVYWPVPSDMDTGKDFYMVHFDGLDRNYNNIDAALEANTPEVIAAELVTISGAQYIKFETGSFSPFVLVYEKETGGGVVTTTYTLHYNTNGGGYIPPESMSYMWIKEFEKLPTPSRDGYTFAGWHHDSDLTTPVQNDIKVHQSKVVIHAAWTANTADPDDTGVSEWLNTDEHFAYLSGYGGGIFAPERNLTRAEAAQMFYNLLLDKDVAITVSFSDVPDGAWYSDAVNTLASLGMIKGVGDNKFEPDRSITRAEFTAIAMRFTKGTADGENSFSDVSADDWFYAQVVGSAKYGWISGYPDGTFRPNNTITRAEVTTIVNRMLGRVADESYIDAHMSGLTIFTDVPNEYWGSYDIIEATNAHDFEKVDGAENWVGLK